MKRNPLNKRIKRELRQDIGKYVAVFLFIVITISLGSGFIVADDSMRHSYDMSFEKYNVEDGHFVLAEEAPDALIAEVEDAGVTVHPLFYKEKEWKKDKVLRLFEVREDVNVQDMVRGTKPDSEDEIAVDRLFGTKNGIEPGDSIKISGRKLKVTGYAALTDYSTMFQNNQDIMFDSSQFGVAVVDKKTFEDLSDAGIGYCYAWINEDEDLSESERKDISDEITETLMKTGLLEEMIPREENQSINFAGEDLGRDRSMFVAFLYILIVIMAFIFAVTTKSTLEREAGAIGALMASGYSKGEMIRHYLVLPVLITLVGALLGNIFGYTWMKKVLAALYLNSYSFTTYETLWSWEAFRLSTIVPVIVVAVIEVIVMLRVFRIKPLQFLRHELRPEKKGRAVKLPNFSFMNRFRLRIIFQNKSIYFIMLLGIILASVLLLFGLFLMPMLDHHAEEIEKSKIAKYQYVLKAEVPTETDGAEEYAAGSVKFGEDELSIFGISDDSEYIDEKMPKGENEVVVSNLFLEKYEMEEGDSFTVKRRYTGEKMKLKIVGTKYYAAGITLFTSRENFEEILDVEEGFFNGYFSNKEIKDIDDLYIATTITERDLKKVSHQMKDSMGDFFKAVLIFSIVLYILLIFLLAKIVVDKNAESISMVKILGYSNREAAGLYNSATTVVVLVSLVISIFVAEGCMRLMFNLIMSSMNGWISYYVTPWALPILIVAGIVCYFIVYQLLIRRVRKIPLAQALKNMD